MRLLIIQPTCDKRGHYGVYTNKLCQALAHLGHHVTLVTNKANPASFLREPPRFDIIEVAGGRYAFSAFDDSIGRSPLRYYWGYFRNSYAITDAAGALCRTQQFDGAAIMDTEFLTAAAVLARHRRHLPPVVMALWASNFSFESYRGSLAKRAYKVMQRELFRRALGSPIRALAVLGEWHRERLRTQLHLPEGYPIVIIPDGGEAPRETPDRSEARAKFGIPAEIPLFLFFGVLRREKGLEFLLDALGRLPRENGRLVLAGWPMEYNPVEIEFLIRRYGIADKVFVRLGYVPDEDVPWLFAACDALVLPYTSAYSGGSGPLMKQACTYRTPVIATDVADMGRLVQEHRLGLVAAPDDAASLAARMREFSELSESVRQQMAGNAAALARAHSWDHLARRFTELFAQLVPTLPS